MTYKIGKESGIEAGAGEFQLEPEPEPSLISQLAARAEAGSGAGLIPWKKSRMLFLAMNYTSVYAHPSPTYSVIGEFLSLI